MYRAGRSCALEERVRSRLLRLVCTCGEYMFPPRHTVCAAGILWQKNKTRKSCTCHVAFKVMVVRPLSRTPRSSFYRSTRTALCSTQCMLTVCTPRHSHGRLFLFNTMVTSKWRAKLSEYALDPYRHETETKQAGGSKHGRRQSLRSVAVVGRELTLIRIYIYIYIVRATLTRFILY